jgi:hypothetical protein
VQVKEGNVHLLTFGQYKMKWFPSAHKGHAMRPDHPTLRRYRRRAGNKCSQQRKCTQLALQSPNDRHQAPRKWSCAKWLSAGNIPAGDGLGALRGLSHKNAEAAPCTCCCSGMERSHGTSIEHECWAQGLPSPSLVGHEHRRSKWWRRVLPNSGATKSWDGLLGKQLILCGNMCAAEKVTNTEWPASLAAYRQSFSWDLERRHGPRTDQKHA